MLLLNSSPCKDIFSHQLCKPQLFSGFQSLYSLEGKGNATLAVVPQQQLELAQDLLPLFHTPVASYYLFLQLEKKKKSLDTPSKLRFLSTPQVTWVLSW